MSLRDGPFPNKGWMFWQPQTKWAIPSPLGVTFHGAVDLIVQHRLKNQSITRKYKLSTNWSDVADELETFTRQRLGLAEDSPPKHFPQRLDEPQAVAGGVEGFLASPARMLKATATGIKVYIDTFGSSGRPVDGAEAERRAAICATCPKNEAGDLSTFFTEKAAAGIMEVLALVKTLDFRTANDEKLGVCSACLCPLKQKVHVKLEHVLRHTDEATIERLKEAPACWIVAGLHNMTATQQNELHA